MRSGWTVFRTSFAGTLSFFWILAVGHIREDVDADGLAPLILSSRPGYSFSQPAARQFPEARQRRLRIAGRIARGIDHARAAAEIDAQQQANLLRRDRCSARQTGCDGSSGLNRYSGFWNTNPIVAGSRVESARRRFASAKRKPSRSTYSWSLGASSLRLFLLLRQGMAAAGNTGRAPARGRPPWPCQIDRLPGQFPSPLRLDLDRQVLDVAAVAVPIDVLAPPCGPHASRIDLGQSTGQRPLERNIKARLVANLRGLWRSPAALPVPAVRGVEVLEQKAAPSRYQSFSPILRRAVSRPASSSP